ncbi:MAG: carboxymuconolactone decarboxylase family protein [Gammaproteobacteria bacterium]|nr:carboxymuconolactone decarboxylase family protein [Gammaproteobacteria bacterium]
MARVRIIEPETVDDPAVRAICDWVTEVEGAVPNHFKIELNFPEFMKAKLGASKVLWETGELSMEEIQHVGIAVSKANGCPYCTAAFCTILNYGLGEDEDYVQSFLRDGLSAVEEKRLRAILEFALEVNADARGVTDAQVQALRGVGLTDKGIVQLVHVVSDFAAYNRLNLALQTDYDYRDLWRRIGFGWTQQPGEAAGDDSRGVRK